MREILFRGKRIDNGDWVYGDYASSGCGIVCMEYLNEHGDAGEVFHPVDLKTIGQFTGLTDKNGKNGKKIFEGDIVRHHNGNPYAIPSIVEKGQVYWDEEYCGWRRTSNGAFHRGEIDTYRMSHDCCYEVIGNIHDNPELVEG